MKFRLKKSAYKKISLALSLCALIIWGILGTGASLAWFADATPEINNIFHFADFNVTVSHQLTDGTWEIIDGQTELFDKNSVYEPGYTQVVYLKVQNTGDRDFLFHTAVNVNGSAATTNAFGQTFYLQDYLRFGITVSPTWEEMKNTIANREMAKEIANMKLHNYATEAAILQPKEICYIALVVGMPENVDNAANYRGAQVPALELGITVKAEQVHQ